MASDGDEEDNPEIDLEKLLTLNQIPDLHPDLLQSAVDIQLPTDIELSLLPSRSRGRYEEAINELADYVDASVDEMQHQRQMFEKMNEINLENSGVQKSAANLDDRHFVDIDPVDQSQQNDNLQNLNNMNDRYTSNFESDFDYNPLLHDDSARDYPYHFHKPREDDDERDWSHVNDEKFANDAESILLMKILDGLRYKNRLLRLNEYK